MKRTVRIFISLALCFVLMAGFAACGDSSNGKVNLDFWHIWGGSDANAAAVAKVIADFEDENPDIKINVTTYENESYKTTIKTNVSGGTAPDVFSSWGAGFSKPFVDTGRVLNLDEYLAGDNTLDRLVGGALVNYTYDDSVYGLTFGLAASGFYVNARLFEENDVKIPTTWLELIDAIEAFNAKGITPIATSIKERWVVGMLFEGLCLKAVGADQMLKTLNKLPGGTFSNPQYLNAAKKILQLADMNAFPADATANTRDEALASMQLGKAAMYFMGSWEAASLDGSSSDEAGNFRYIGFPSLADGNGSSTEFNGGSVDGIMINADTAHPEEAVKFALYFTENLSREGYSAGNYLPMWKSAADADTSNLPASFVDIVDATASATNYVLWWDTLLEGDDVVIYQDALDAMLNRTITPEEFIVQLQRICP